MNTIQPVPTTCQAAVLVGNLVFKNPQASLLERIKTFILSFFISNGTPRQIEMRNKLVTLSEKLASAKNPQTQKNTTRSILAEFSAAAIHHKLCKTDQEVRELFLKTMGDLAKASRNAAMPLSDANLILLTDWIKTDSHLDENSNSTEIPTTRLSFKKVALVTALLATASIFSYGAFYSYKRAFAQPLTPATDISSALADLTNSEFSIRGRANYLFQVLIEKGHGINKAIAAKAIAAAEAALTDSEVFIRGRSIYLFEMLIEKGHGINEAIAAAEAALTDSQAVSIGRGTELFEMLIENGHGINEAIAAAEAASADSEAYIRLRANYLFKTLSENGHGICRQI